MKIIRQGVVRGVTVGLSLLMFAGCDDFLDVDNPGSLLDEDLERPELLATLANTPEANIAGTMSSLNTRSGLLSDELFHPRTQQENIDAMAGNRLASSSAVEGHWRSLSQSRFLSDEVASRLLSAGGTPSDIARAYFFAGTARMAMADHFNVIVYDHEDTPKGPITVINDAITAFTQSASHGTGNVKAAALGQIARAYRSLYFEEKHLRGNTDASLFSQAESFAQQALAADSDYNLSLRYGSPGGDNGQYSLGSIGTGSNLIDSIYIRLADPVTGIWDPRIPHEDEDIVEVNVGDLAGAVSMINENRAAARSRVSASDWGGGTARGWPPASPISDLSDFVSTDATEVYDQLKHERRAEFFVELRRWPDMRYYEIFPYRWLSTNVAAGVHLRWPVAPEEIATNENLSLAQTKVVYVN